MHETVHLYASAEREVHESESDQGRDRTSAFQSVVTRVVYFDLKYWMRWIEIVSCGSSCCPLHHQRCSRINLFLQKPVQPLPSKISSTSIISSVFQPLLPPLHQFASVPTLPKINRTWFPRTVPLKESHWYASRSIQTTEKLHVCPPLRSNDGRSDDDDDHLPLHLQSYLPPHWISLPQTPLPELHYCRSIVPPWHSFVSYERTSS
mmetsp:Transcript_15400/g.33273  ORF Transcript_15400/g.33273 Transcript_15400/m.33273 type:complete len:206 (-) Transcript_15400:704-1321(-)